MGGLGGFEESGLEKGFHFISLLSDQLRNEKEVDTTETNPQHDKGTLPTNFLAMPLLFLNELKAPFQRAKG